MKSKKLLFTFLSIAFIAIKGFSQSNPVAHDLGSGAYTFLEWDSLSAAGTYPNNMVFHCTQTLEGTVFTPNRDYACPYNLTTRARITGQRTNGVSFINTGSSLTINCSNSGAAQPKYMGAAVVALNTLGQELVQVSWKGRMFTNFTYSSVNQSRFYSIKLQYRPDSTSAFLDVPGAVEFTSNASASSYKPVGTVETLPQVTLPAICSNNPYVQLRWLYYQDLTGAGQRPELGIDDININSVGNNFNASISADGPTSFCQGSSVVLSCSDATSFLWSNGSTAQNITVQNSGSYFVTATNSNGTSAVSNSIQVSILPAPNAAISFSGASGICDGASVTLNANLGASYLWSNGATTNTLVVDTPGDYSVVVTYNNGCTSTSNPVTISNSTAPPVPEITYNGGFDMVSTVAVGYQWYLNSVAIAGATSQFYTPTENGIYSVIVSNENGCTSVSLPFEWLITSLNKNSNSSLTIFPNPSQTQINVSWDAEKIKSVEIYDLIGNLVLIENENFSKVNVSNLSSGNYFVKIYNAKGHTENRFLNKQ